MTDLAAGSLRIAIVKLSSLGDVIHALPVARALRAARPRAHVEWIVETRERAILRDHPDLDAVIPVDTRRWRRLVRRPAGARQVCRELRDVRRRLRSARFDVALDLQGLIKSGLLTAMTGARLRIGFAADRCRERVSALCTNRRIAPPAGAHVVEQYLALLGALGITPGPPEWRIQTHRAAEARIEEFLGEHGVKRRDTVVAINPGAGREDKRWPVDRLAAVAERLAAERGGRILLLWGPDEIHMARQIRDAISARAILAPPTDLDELAALLRRTSLLIANDTGPLHLGAALGTPCIGLFGPTRAERNGPYGRHCRGIQSPDSTMAGLRVEPVVAAAGALLDARDAHA